MPGTRSTCRGVRPTSATRNGCNVCTSTVCCGPDSSLRPRSPGCVRTSGSGSGDYAAQALELYDVYQTKVAACDKQIEAILKRLKESATPPASKLLPPKHRSRQPNAPS